MQLIDKLLEEGGDMEAGKYVILDEQSHRYPLDATKHERKTLSSKNLE